MLTRLFIALGLLAAIATPSAQTDLDAFMARVLARRDENWKKLQQYVLEERETFRIDGAAGSRLFGFEREYSWFIRDGVFIRSPVKADGVAIDEAERRQEENRWLRREQRREARRVARGLEGLEPRFVSSAYFLEFKFDPGQYALAAREQLDGREVLRIEYYPTKLFTEGRTRPNRRARERDDQIEEKMNKVSLVTLWVDPAEHQILQYRVPQHRHGLPARPRPGARGQSLVVDAHGRAVSRCLAPALDRNASRRHARDGQHERPLRRRVLRLPACGRQHPGPMTIGRVLCRCVAAVCLGGAPAIAQAPETIAEIRVHGNHTTPDTDILALAALATGEPATDARLAEAEGRLRASGRFAGVEVRRRNRSIADPSEILVILLVDEHDAVGGDNLVPGPAARMLSAGMLLPIVGYADGYGLTYGARVSFIEPLGPGTRVSVPATWGGERRAAVEVERRFGRRAIDPPARGAVPTEDTSSGANVLVRGSASLSRRVNPHYDVPDARREFTAHVERPLRPWLRAGASGRVARVDFAETQAWHQAAGVQLTFDTRGDPSFPRNAVHATLGVDRIHFAGGSAARASADFHGYAGIGGSAVLALRAAAARAGAPLPPPEEMLLGGSTTLRGYRAGHRAGDGLALLSAEVRMPLTSPLNVGRFGVKAFVDAGTTWDAGARLADQRFDRGIGAGVYFGAAVVTANVDVAWPETGKPRVHVAVGVSF